MLAHSIEWRIGGAAPTIGQPGNLPGILQSQGIGVEILHSQPYIQSESSER